VAVLVDPGNLSTGTALQAMETTARSVKVTLHQFAVRGPHEFDSAFAAMVKKRVGAVGVLDQPMFTANAKAIADLAAKQRLPLIGSGEFAEAGGVIGYGANLLDLYRRVGYFVDKILKGTKPGVIPIEQPTRFELVVNMKTAKTIGVTIPQTFLQRADRLIE
jgi:putative ABC transport system substrate-binding protein